MDWRKVDDQWFNFSKFRCLYVKITNCGRYTICVKDDEPDGDTFYLFDKFFDTEKEADRFLNDFMEQNR